MTCADDPYCTGCTYYSYSTYSHPMTPEDLDRLHAEAVERGYPAQRLERLRAAALREVGSVEEMARWATVHRSFAEYLADLRRS